MPLFDAQCTLLAAAGTLTGLVSDPSSHLTEVALQQFEVHALHLVATTRVAEILAEKGERGLEFTRSPRDLVLSGRSFTAQTHSSSPPEAGLMRRLCSIHLFAEAGLGVFATDRITWSLVSNKPLRAYALSYGQGAYTASDEPPSDPTPLPANYGYFTRYSHMRNLPIMSATTASRY